MKPCFEGAYGKAMHGTFAAIGFLMPDGDSRTSASWAGLKKKGVF
jgi:hypothetical protein